MIIHIRSLNSTEISKVPLNRAFLHLFLLRENNLKTIISGKYFSGVKIHRFSDDFGSFFAFFYVFLV